MRTPPPFSPKFRALLWLAGGTVAVSSCDSPPPAEPNTAVRAPVVPPPFAPTDATSINFAGASAQLNLVAGVPTTVQVQVQPPDRYTVRFSITGGDEPFNVFLEQAEAETDATGLGSVTIHARGTNSNTPRLVAALGSLTTTPLFLIVRASTDATLSVRALEPAGSTREVSQWVLSAHIDTLCSELEGTPPPDGPLNVTAAYTGPEQEVVLNAVPSGQDLAIVLRAGQFAGGCKNLRPLNPNSQYLTDLEVGLRPMHLDATSLALDFGLDEATEFDALYGDFAFRIANALSVEGKDDLDAVFDAMAILSDTPATFELARVDNAWRAVWLMEQGTDLAGAGTRDLVRSWMQSGLAALTEPGALQGTLDVPDELGAASFSLNSVARNPPEESGFFTPTAATLVAEANDFLRIDLALRWEPNTYLFAAAQRQAVLERPSTSSVPTALASAFDCQKLGNILTVASPDPSEFAFATCDSECVEQLCDRAMESLWDQMTATTLPEVQWAFAASAQATVDNDARPQLASGGSLHTLASDGIELNVTGTFSTIALPPPPDPETGSSGD